MAAITVSDAHHVPSIFIYGISHDKYISDAVNTIAKLVYLTARKVEREVAPIKITQVFGRAGSKEANLVEVVPVFNFFLVLVNEVAVCFVEASVNNLSADTDGRDTVQYIATYRLENSTYSTPAYSATGYITVNFKRRRTLHKDNYSTEHCPVTHSATTSFRRKTVRMDLGFLLLLLNIYLDIMIS